MGRGTRLAAALSTAAIIASVGLADARGQTTPAPTGEEAPARPLVVLVADQASTEIVTRVRIELVTMGFDVRVVEPAGPPSTGPSEAAATSLEAVARGEGAAAAIRVARTPTGAEAAIADRVTGKTVRREVDAADPPTIAIRIVELFRASLLEVRARHPSRGDVASNATIDAIADAEHVQPPPPAPALLGTPPAPPPARQPRLPERSPPSDGRRVVFGGGLGAGALWSAGGIPASAMLELAAHVMPWRRVGFTAFAQMPLSGVGREGTEGTRRSWPGLVGLGFRIPLVDDTWWEPAVEGGVGGAWFRVTGEASSESYVGSTQDAFAAVPHLRPGLAVRLIGPLRIVTRGLAGVAVPRIVVDAAGRETDSWGQPLLGVSLGLELVRGRGGDEP